jgi:hypothetical protein
VSYLDDSAEAPANAPVATGRIQLAVLGGGSRPPTVGSDRVRRADDDSASMASPMPTLLALMALLVAPPFLREGCGSNLSGP